MSIAPALLLLAALTFTACSNYLEEFQDENEYLFADDSGKSGDTQKSDGEKIDDEGEDISSSESKETGENNKSGDKKLNDDETSQSSANEPNSASSSSSDKQTSSKSSASSYKDECTGGDWKDLYIDTAYSATGLQLNPTSILTNDEYKYFSFNLLSTVRMNDVGTLCVVYKDSTAEKNFYLASVNYTAHPYSVVWIRSFDESDESDESKQLKHVFKVEMDNTKGETRQGEYVMTRVNSFAVSENVRLYRVAYNGKITEASPSSEESSSSVVPQSGTASSSSAKSSSSVQSSSSMKSSSSVQSSSSVKSSSSVQSSSSTKSSSSQSLPEGLTSVASCTGDTLYNKNSNDDEFLFGDSYWWSDDMYRYYKDFIFGPADYDISSWDHFCVTYVAKDSVGLTLVNAASNYQKYKTAPKLPSGNHSIEVALNAFTGGDLNAFEILTFSASNQWTEAPEIKTITVKKDTRDIFPYFDDVAEKTDDLTPVYYVGQTLNVDNTEFYAVSHGGGAASSNKGKIMKAYTGNCISGTCYVEFGLNTIKGSALHDWGGVCFEIASTGNYDVEVSRNAKDIIDELGIDWVSLGTVTGNKTPTAQLHCHNWNSFKNGSSKMALSSDDYMHAIRIVFKDKKQSVYIRNVYKYEETCKVADVGKCNTVSN